ncbi:MAG: methyltransferase, TIGR04325 family [Longimicrobiales bacterium]
MATVPRSKRAGYAKADPDLFYDAMARLFVWDYPVLYWLRRLLPDARTLLDAGGHQATKFRVFDPYLDWPEGFRWVVWDLPDVVRAGSERARRDGLHRVSFVERLSDAEPADVLLVSGLLQFVDVGLEELLGRLTSLPRHLLLNKVAVRDGPTLLTLENMGDTASPYRILNEADFVRSLENLGYREVDRWEIPDLSHIIPLYEHLGPSRSLGFLWTRQDTAPDASGG